MQCIHDEITHSYPSNIPSSKSAKSLLKSIRRSHPNISPSIPLNAEIHLKIANIVLISTNYLTAIYLIIQSVLIRVHISTYTYNIRMSLQ